MADRFHTSQRRVRFELLMLLVPLVAIGGCSSLPAPTPLPSSSAAGAAPALATFKTSKARAMLHGQPLDLHLAIPDHHVPGSPIVLYASGDGGWFGAAVDMFKQLARAGYPVVGFSSRAFLKLDRPHGGLVDAAQLAADYESIVVAARAALNQGDTNRVVLTGWSRGAAFAVLAAAEPVMRDHVAGIIAIGLSAGEDLAPGSDADATDDDTEGDEPGREWRFDNYATIAQLDPIRSAVIQASHDNYLSAADARRLFGPDTVHRRLYIIDAKNHRFSGGKAEFEAALLEALRWITTQPEPATQVDPLETRS